MKLAEELKEKLIGVYNPVGNEPCFASPVFLLEDGYYIQIIDENGGIKGVSPISLDEKAIYKTSMPVHTTNDQAIYAFYFSPNDICIGDKSSLRLAIRERYEDYSDRPALLLEIADFLDDNDLKAQAQLKTSTNVPQLFPSNVNREELTNKVLTKNLSVGISYPNAIVMEGIADVLERQNFKVIFRATDVSGIYEACSDITPDVILISTGSAGFCLSDVARLAARASVIVMVSKVLPLISVEEAVKAGVSGIISTDDTVDNFIQGIQSAVEGNFSITRGLAKTMAGPSTTKTPTNVPSQLNSREAEVLELISKGMTNREIGEKLYISTYTVKAHMRNITTKFKLEKHQQAMIEMEQLKELLENDQPISAYLSKLEKMKLLLENHRQPNDYLCELEQFIELLENRQQMNDYLSELERLSKLLKNHQQTSDYSSKPERMSKLIVDEPGETGKTIE